ncbi:MAG: FMN-binding protein [Candidatus Marinimicrobia bacterium]|mgnify:FL=1|jgi:Na+-transporting NADH:ubiquinone oxidoreductase subunit C|nr:FMN-binding protein [Candidatus Neomarinimicrobiota bacterium]
MYSNNYTLGFVFIVTLVLGTMLSFTKDSVKSLQDQNLKADVQKTILRSLNFEENLLESNESIEQTFKNYIDAKCVNVEGEIVECNIEEVDIEKNEETLPIYIRMNNEKIEGIALPIAGKGLWSTIFGYIALNPDTDSVLGIQFYKHGETPGLGGEVEKKWFTDNFVNHPIKESNGEITYVPKKIRNENGKIISISVIKGGVDYSKSNKSAIHQVDGISGATVTADGVSDFLLEDLLRYEKTLDKIRDYGTI